MKKKYITAQQIDGHKAINTPHARELKEMGKNKVNIFLNGNYEQINGIIKNRLKGKIENINFGEDYTITLKFFPEVNIHILYYNYEDEEDEAFNRAELRFLFSGDKISWIPTEDTVSFIELSLNYLEDLLKSEKKIYDIPNKKSDLLEMALKQRTIPFKHLESVHLGSLAEFVGGNVENNDNIWILTKSFFQGMDIKLIYDKNNEILDLKFQGRNIKNINLYARNQLGIFFMNHCLRFLSISYPKIEFPKIVKKTFSYPYIKKNFDSD